MRSTRFKINRFVSSPVVSATDSRSVALHRTLRDLLRAGMHHPLEVVAVDPIESQWHRAKGLKTADPLVARISAPLRPETSHFV